MSDADHTVLDACLTGPQREKLLAGALAAGEREACEAHVERCPQCQEQLAALAAGAAFGGSSLPAEPPAAGQLAEDAAVERLKEKVPAAVTPHLPGPQRQPVWPDSNVPGYEILDVLGRGGMGVVYLARQTRLKRLVALKMILRGTDARTEDRARFLTEAESVAALHHPNIVQIYETGEHQGCPYLVLEYVDGGSLADKTGRAPQPARAAAALTETLARAVHYAHQCGIIHRDLKPGNILLVSGGVVSGGRGKKPLSSHHSLFTAPPSPLTTHHSPLTTHQPKITDFGLAKRIESDADLTQTGQLLGTPSYMAPEQAEGRRKELGPATDVYALGAILYELLTGLPPFASDSPLETLRQVIASEPLAPRRLQPRLPRDLETICLKCLEKRPARRYASAVELADDLRRFLDGAPIQARRVHRLERSVKWARRHPPAAALILVLTLLVVVGFPGFTWLWLDAVWSRGQVQQEMLHAETARDAADKAREAADNLRRQGQRRETRLALDRGQMLCERGEVGRGLLWLVNSLQLATAASDAELERVLRVNLADWGARVCVAGRSLQLMKINGLALHPAGKTILIADNLSAAQFDVATGKPVGFPLVTLFNDPLRTVWSVAYSPDGGKALVGKSFGKALLWDLHKGRMIGPPLAHGGPDVWHVAFSRRGDLAITAGGDDADGAAVKLWDSATGRLVGECRGHRDAISSFDVSPDGRRLLTGSWDRTVQLWDLGSRKPLGHPGVMADKVSVVAFGPDGQTAVSGSRDGTVQFWETSAGAVDTGAASAGAASAGAAGATPQSLAAVGLRAVGDPLQHLGDVSGVVFSPDGRLLVTSSSDGTARLWNAQTRKPLGWVLQHESSARALTLGPDGRLGAVGCEDGRVVFFQMPRTKAVGEPLEHDRRVEQASFSPDGKTLITTSRDGAAVWDGHPLRLRGRTGSSAAARAAAYTPGGSLIALAPWKGDIELWDGAAPAPRPLGPPLHTKDWVIAMALSRDGRRLFTVEDAPRKEVQRWDIAARKQDAPLRLAAEVTDLAVSPDDNRLATACRDATIHQWDTATGKRVGPPIKLTDRVEALAWSPDSRRIATASRNGNVRLWHAATGEPLLPLLHHEGGALAVAFSPDGRWLVTGGADRTARLWDLATGTQLGSPVSHQDAVKTVTFHPSGESFLTGSLDRKAQLWEVPPAPLVGSVEAIKHWAEVLAGAELDSGGAVHRLDGEELRQRRRLLREGAPAALAGVAAFAE